MLDVVAAIMINEDKEVFIAQRSRPEELAGGWEFPGGKIEAGEKPKDSLIREMKEEFGIEINVDRFFIENVYEYDFGKVRILAYLAKLKSGKIEVKEHKDAKWVKIKDINNYEFVPADIEIVAKIKKEKDEVFLCFQNQTC